ncbi:MAG: 50S ribosomal protein L20 [Candidatus Moranbacteria bacterium GW2011_GWE1_49_15]|nr:MAG: 50S ribosomal protein L20 [Candidatus Moranbacteria bacterium GW2011_GWE2_47_10]KKW06696.1 MAG: 50S ribosomal protein L20 [Candidatus Moranbacteria bacterium GW2011_GWE1_49_15]HBP00746.1 50S ribosomal protein L20 [Candidatus Moranbacteria bacterium]
MARVKRGMMASKRRKNVLKMAKGFKWRRKSNFRAAKEALLKAGKYAHRDRRAKKRTNRRLWITRLNNAVRELGNTYSKFIKTLTDKKIELDRKVLSQMAQENPEVFKKLVEKVG